MVSEDMSGSAQVESGPARRLHRSTSDKVVAGVCGGLGEYFGVEAVWFRLAFVLLVIAGAGGGAVLYVVAWVVLPVGEGEPVARGGTAGGVLVGGALIAIGLLWLADAVFPWASRIFGPLALVVFGVALVWGGGRRDRG